MSDQLGEWTNVTNVEITALDDQDDERGPYRARLWWEDEDDIRAAAREIEVGPVHFVTFATGRTRPEGSGEMRWEDPRGAPVTLYRQPDRKVGLVVGDMEDAPPTHLSPEEDRGDEPLVDCMACGQEKVVQEEGDYIDRDICPDCWGPWLEEAKASAPDWVPCFHDGHDGHDIDQATLNKYLETGNPPTPFSCFWVPVTVAEWVRACCGIDPRADYPGRNVVFLDDREREGLMAPERLDEADREEIYDRARKKVEAIEPELRLIQETVGIWETWTPSGHETRLTCEGCDRKKIVDRVTTEAVGEDLTARAENWHYTRPRAPTEEPLPTRRLCPPCWADWVAAAQELAPDRVACIDDDHDGHEVDPTAITRYLEAGHPPYGFRQPCIPVTVGEWLDLCDVDPGDAALRSEEAEEG